MEKKIFAVLLIILLVFFGRIFGKKIFDPAKKVAVDNKVVNNLNVKTDNALSDDKENIVVEANTSDHTTNNSEGTDRKDKEDNKKYDYMDLYPDLYVKPSEESSLSPTESYILDTRKDIFEHSEGNHDQQEVGEEKKVAFLTFDDGPSDNTRKVLDILEEHDIKATFFVIADTVTPDRYDLIKEMYNDGHLIGIHTYTHNYRQIYSSVKAYLDDFYLAYSRIKEVNGVAPTVFRFPGGSYNCFMKPIRKQIIEEMQRRGFKYYDWHVSAEDSVGNPSKASIMRNIKKNYKKYNTPIILLHDSSINKLITETLNDIICLYEEAGYTFDTVDHRVSRKLK